MPAGVRLDQVDGPLPGGSHAGRDGQRREMVVGIPLCRYGTGARDAPRYRGALVRSPGILYPFGLSQLELLVHEHEEVLY